MENGEDSRLPSIAYSTSVYILAEYGNGNKVNTFVRYKDGFRCRRSSEEAPYEEKDFDSAGYLYYNENRKRRCDMRLSS